MTFWKRGLQGLFSKFNGSKMESQTFNSTKRPRIPVPKNESNGSEDDNPPRVRISQKNRRRRMSLYDFEEPEAEVRKENRGCGWWEPDNERNLAQYFMQTSIHGLKYLGEPRRHICERLFWIFAFGMNVVATVYLINSVWIKYRESPVIVTFESKETFIEQIPFPAVTICNMNKVLKSKANEYMRLATEGPEHDRTTQQARRNVYYLDHVCSTSNKPFSKAFNYSSTVGTVDPEILKLVTSSTNPYHEDVENVADFLQNASQTCADMLKLCMWQGEVYNCSELFKPIETNFGKCCTFNMIPQTLLHRYQNDSRDRVKDLEDWNNWDLDKDGLLLPAESTKKYPRRQNRAGKSSGLAFLADPDIEEYFCTSSDSTGFRLATHLSTDVPHVTDFGLAIRPNYEHFISVKPEITMADDIIRAYPTDKRSCYLDGEHRLKYYNYYTAWNCFDECITNLTYEKCNCVRYYMPRDDKRELCGPANFTCAEDVKTSSFKSRLHSDWSICQSCLPSCTEIKYFAQTSSTPFRRRVDLWVDEFNVSTSWARSNISIIHVYFGQESTYARVRTQLYGITDLIANFGGLMGLCMGFSGLSLIEIIYFFTMRVWCRRRRKKWVKRHGESSERSSLQENQLKHYSNVNVAFDNGSSKSSKNNIDMAADEILTGSYTRYRRDNGISEDDPEVSVSRF